MLYIWHTCTGVHCTVVCSVYTFTLSCALHLTCTGVHCTVVYYNMCSVYSCTSVHWTYMYRGHCTVVCCVYSCTSTSVKFTVLYSLHISAWVQCYVLYKWFTVLYCTVMYIFMCTVLYCTVNINVLVYFTILHSEQTCRGVYFTIPYTV